MSVYHRGSAFLSDACLTEGLISGIIKVSFIFSFSYSYKQIFGYLRLPSATSPLSHPFSSTLQTHYSIPWVSLRRSCSTSGSLEAQPAPGLLCWEGREITRLNLGKWLWLQGWPEQLIPIPYPAKSQNKTKLIQVERKHCLICLFFQQSSSTVGTFPATRLRSLPSGTQCPTSSVWENCSTGIKSTLSAQIVIPEILLGTNYHNHFTCKIQKEKA